MAPCLLVFLVGCHGVGSPCDGCHWVVFCCVGRNGACFVVSIGVFVMLAVVVFALVLGLVFFCVGAGVSLVGLHALLAGFHAVGFLLLAVMVLALHVLAVIVFKCFFLSFLKSRFV